MPTYLSRAAAITLEYIDPKYKYIARNRDFTITVFEHEPIKGELEWKDPLAPSLTLNDCGAFKMLKWEDQHAFRISDFYYD